MSNHQQSQPVSNPGQLANGTVEDTGATPGLDLQDPIGLQPSDSVAARLQTGSRLARAGNTAEAAEVYASAAHVALQTDDQPGYARSLAQLAALEESCGEVSLAQEHNRQAQDVFLAIGDGAGLVQTYRLDGFLCLRMGQTTAAATGFSAALGLALQLDTRLVMTTLNQVVPAAHYLIEQDQLAALLPLGAGLMQAVANVEQERGTWPAEMADFADMARTIGGVFAPLGVMADEEGLSDQQRRDLAARSTHQAWLVDALTRRRWGLAALVKEALQSRLDFHEELD